MKKIIFSMVLAVIMALPLLADDSSDYVPIVREGVEWGHKAVLGYGSTAIVKYYRMQLKGDSVVNGTTYKKCYRYTDSELDVSNSEIVALMREDDKKVYVYDYYNYTIPYFYEKVYDIDSLCRVAKHISVLNIDGKRRKLIETDDRRCRKFLEGIGVIDDDAHLSEFPFPFYPELSGSGYYDIYITYEKNVGGEIVYKTEFFDANDPAIRPEGVAQVIDGAADVRVYGTDGAAVIDGDGVGYAVYSADGLQEATGIADGETEISLPSGLYIVRTGSRATKIAVK